MDDFDSPKPKLNLLNLPLSLLKLKKTMATDFMVKKALV